MARYGSISEDDLTLTVENDKNYRTSMFLDFEEPNKKSGLSTFNGAFVPCVLSIFGIILFERIGWIIGQAGLYLALVILFSGYAMVTLTTLSLSAIATNGKVKGGGAYYMISRSLGPALGGSVGVVFYAANIFAGGTYMSGYTSAIKASFGKNGGDSVIVEILPDGYWAMFLYGTITLGFLGLICLVGADAFAKASILIFFVMWGCLACGIGSLWFEPAGFRGYDSFTSWSTKTFSNNTLPLYQDDTPPNENVGHVNFQAVFAVFFPAVTGIMAGANMSGDLKNPGRAIPYGTLSAIGVTLIYYLMIIFTLALTVDRFGLSNYFFIIQYICFWQPIITLGIFMSSLSSALSVLIGSARILQALARDKLIPFIGFLGYGSKGKDEPRYAVLLSWFLIQMTLFLGTNVNVLATWTTMFFLLSYGFVNFACCFLKLTSAPNFRPTFKYFSWWSAIIGAVLCIGGMIYVNPWASIASITLVAFLIVFIAYRAVPTEWGDITQGLMYHQVRKYLLRLDLNTHVKYWRPQILLLVNNPKKNVNLMDFVNSMKKSGLYIIGNVIVGHYSDMGKYIKPYTYKWLDYVTKSKIKAFSEVTLAPSLPVGAQNLILNSGLGAMKPNTIVIPFHYGNNGISARDDIIYQEEEEDYKKKALEELPISMKSKNKNQEYANLIFQDYQTLQGADSDYADLSPEEYVELLHQCIYFGKNLIISRNFNKLDKELIVAFRGNRLDFTTRKHRMTIDMWPTFLTNSDYSKSISLILMFGFLTKQTDIWNWYSKLRVKGIAITDADIPQEVERLTKIIQIYRIKAKVEVYSLESLANELPTYQQEIMNGNLQKDGSNFYEIPNTTRYQIFNEVMKQNSQLTCCILTSLPPPPISTEESEEYLSDISTLSENLPPVLMTHASESISSFVALEL
eukprot:TRINITY_DN2290_c1_g2_i1.p1 TRINITY_DN2290_c1_g2~~TRINITY_DN2290_c1_g2_i1.p1  ORF type:complete len:912 (+),score=280.72 TRINITY_DN2290_c1_g2_i1:115-2850(+)